MGLMETWDNSTSLQKGAAGLQMSGGIMQGIGAYAKMQTQAGLSEFNARQSMLDAQITVQNAEEQAEALREHGRKLTGEQRTARAISGVRLEGTPLEVMADTIENIELDAIRIRQEGRFQKAQLETQAEWQEEQAKSAERAGTLGLISGVLGGATSAAGMFV